MLFSTGQDMGSLGVCYSMQQFSSCMCACLNLIEHQVSTRPIERYPCVESCIVIGFDLFGDRFLYIQCLLWLANFRIAVAEFCEDAAERVEEVGFIIPVVCLRRLMSG